MKNLLPILMLSTIATSGFADQSVYSTKLDNGWSDWSWAKVTKSGPMINVVVRKDWEGLYFHHDDQSSKGFAAISFKVFGGKKGGQRLQVMATIKHKPLTAAEYLSPLPAGKWITITVPVAKLGLKGQAFDGFWVQAQKAGSYQVTTVLLKTK